MQPSDLSFSWLKTIEQSTLSKNLFLKADRSLLQVITLIGWQLLLCDRIIDCFQFILVYPWLEKSANQKSLSLDIHQTSVLRRDTWRSLCYLVTNKQIFHPQQMLWPLFLEKIAPLVGF